MITCEFTAQLEFKMQSSHRSSRYLSTAFSQKARLKGYSSTHILTFSLMSNELQKVHEDGRDAREKQT